MADWEFELDQEFMDMLQEDLDYDNIAPQLLEAVEPLLKDSLISEMKDHVETSSMIGSIRSQVKKNDIGWFLTTYPRGKDANGIRNMDKAMYIHFGTDEISPDPMFTRAVKNIESEAYEIMEKTYGEIANGEK